ncbi:M20/M25/M40 family metallo-hydrolase [Fredinandcohnia humi]
MSTEVVTNVKLKKWVEELVDFARIPNNVYDSSQIRENAMYLKRIMEEKGIHTEIIETPTNRPLVYGEMMSPNATKTILIYSHFDGVPVETENWISDPYTPTIRELLSDTLIEKLEDLSEGREVDKKALSKYRLFARSIADSKNSIIASLVALDYLREKGIELAVNVKFLFDGEEEVESPSLKDCLNKYKEKFKSDLVISASGETHQSGLPTVELGFRGILQFNIRVVTGLVDLHSGHFGNFLPNAAFQMATLIASMKHDNGMIAIKGFYDNVVPLSDTERSIINKIPRVEEELKDRFGISGAEIKGRSLQELIHLPTLNVRGISAGYVGDEARNIIPSLASAEFDVRLVKGMDPEHIYQLLKSHIMNQGWSVMEYFPTMQEIKDLDKIVVIEKKAGFPATRTSLESTTAQYVIRSVKEVFGEDVVVMPSEGGSLPLYLFEELNTPVIGLPTSNYDCNQHTHNENVRLDFYVRAIETYYSLYRNSINLNNTSY